jgi:hypothetical protein
LIFGKTKHNIGDTIKPYNRILKKMLTVDKNLKLGLSYNLGTLRTRFIKTGVSKNFENI